MTQSEKTKRLTECGVLIAMAAVLSMFQFTGPWLNGGSVTLFSMVPICIISYRYGIKWGVFCGGIYGFIQLMMGIGQLKGISMTVLFGTVLLDYLLAYSFLGLAGIFKAISNRPEYFAAGALFAAFCRFICHFISGIVLWGSIVQDGFVPVVIFSFNYNIGYMGPEMVITPIGAFVVWQVLRITGRIIV